MLASDISGIVREQIRRRRSAGNASLAFDDSLGAVSARGGGYIGRFGPWVVGTVADEDGNFDAGATFQRPAGDKDFRLTLRTIRGVYAADDDSRRFDGRAAGIVGDIIRGNTRFDVGAGHERLSPNGPDAGRWYVPASVRRKTGVVGLSRERHFGRIGNGDEVAVAFPRFDALSRTTGRDSARPWFRQRHMHPCAGTLAPMRSPHPLPHSQSSVSRQDCNWLK